MPSLSRCCAVTDHTANSHSALQVKLFTQAFTDKVPIYPILLASTKAELEEKKQTLADGLKARVPGCFAHLQTHHSIVHSSKSYDSTHLVSRLLLSRGVTLLPLVAVQYLERFLQKYALPEALGYFLGSEYSYAETVGGLGQVPPCCIDGVVTTCRVGVTSTFRNGNWCRIHTDHDPICATRHPGTARVPFCRFPWHQ
jgi:hypothetical protein